MDQERQSKMLRFVQFLMSLSLPLCVHGTEYSKTSAGLTSIPDGIPTSVTILMLKSNRITHIHNGDLTSYKLLNKLDLSKNKLTSSNIDENAFDGLDVLEEISLAKNSLQNLSFLIPVARTLTLLNVEDNKITFLEPFYFSSFTELKSLHLKGNDIETLFDNTFVGLNNLIFLDMADNGLSDTHNETTHDQTFKGLVKLEILNLPDNSLTQFPCIGPHNSGALKEIYLQGNNELKNAKAACAAGLDNVQILQLDKTKIKSLKWLSGTMSQLQELSVGENGFADVETHTFQHMHNITNINIGGKMTVLECLRHRLRRTS